MGLEWGLRICVVQVRCFKRMVYRYVVFAMRASTVDSANPIITSVVYAKRKNRGNVVLWCLVCGGGMCAWKIKTESGY